MLSLGVGLTGVKSSIVLPTAIPGLKAWYDASDLSAITDAGGGAVSQWADKSGNGYHATQSTGAQRPVTGTRTVKGANGLDFNGTSHNLILPSGLYSLSAGANTIIAIFAADLSGDATQRIINGQDAGTGRFYMGINATGLTAANNATGSGATTETWTKDANAHMAVFTRNGTAQTNNIDGGTGASNSSGTDLTMTQLLLGGQSSSANRFDGILCELMLYGRALPNVELNRLAAAARQKWGIAWTDV